MLSYKLQSHLTITVYVYWLTTPSFYVYTSMEKLLLSFIKNNSKAVHYLASILEVPNYDKPVQKLPQFVFFCPHSSPQGFHHYQLNLLYFCLDKVCVMLIYFSSEVNLILNSYLSFFAFCMKPS